MQLTTTQRETLTAAIDRLIPADHFPGAADAGVLQFINELFDRDAADKRQQLLAGVDGLNDQAIARGSKSFAASSVIEQDAVLAEVERGESRCPWMVPLKPFFDLLLNVVAEGFYGNTAGGRSPQSWEMIGYNPGANRP